MLFALPWRRNKAAGVPAEKRYPALVILSMAFVVLLLALACLADVLAPYDYRTQMLRLRLAPPVFLGGTSAHWLGTDELGRDIYTRMLFGARASLMAGLASVVIAMAVGIPFGLLSGYFGGWVDSSISRVTEALLAIPFLILAIALAAFLGPSLINAMVAIGVSAAPKFVRLARGQVLAVKNEDYVASARALGASDTRIIVRHILPNIMPPLIVQATITIATAIIAEASLSFLGLGLQPPNPSWGSMLNTAKNFMTQAPWMSIFPGSAIFLAVLGFNLLGDGLRDALDPRQEK
jgi:peptide/nickel transport system permease protein